MRKSSSCSAPLTTRPRRLWFRIATSLNSLPPSYSSPRLLTDQHFISLLTRKCPPSMILGSWRQRQRIQRRRLFRKWHWRSASPWGLANFQAVFGNLTARAPVPHCGAGVLVRASGGASASPSSFSRASVTVCEIHSKPHLQVNNGRQSFDRDLDGARSLGAARGERSFVFRE